MDYLLRRLYKAWKRGDVREDRQDALSATLQSEFSDWFLELFKKNPDGFVDELNNLVLTAYNIAPRWGQFLVRYLAARFAEKAQHNTPTWMSVPLLVFVGGYFAALEEASKKNPKASVDDVKAAAEAFAQEAKNAASSAFKEFEKAKASLASLTQKPGVPVAQQNTGRTAGSNKKVGLLEIVEDLAPHWKAFRGLISKGADRGEDHVQTLARVGFVMNGIAVATVVVSILFGYAWRGFGSYLMAANVVVWSLVWIVGPFAAYYAWRENEARISREMGDEQKNPYGVPGNGPAEAAALGVTMFFSFGIGTLVVASITLFAAYTHFAWAYMWVGLGAVAVAFFTWSVNDSVINVVKWLLRVLLPERFESVDLQISSKGVRHMLLFALVYCIIAIPPVLNGQWVATDYGIGGGVILGMVFGLLGAYGLTRSTLKPELGQSGPHDLLPLVGKFRSEDFRTLRWLSLVGASTVFAVVTLFNMVVLGVNPLNHPDDEPSYQERFEPTRARRFPGHEGPDSGDKVAVEFGSRMTPEVCNVLDPIRDAELVAACRRAEELDAIPGTNSARRSTKRMGLPDLSPGTMILVAAGTTLFLVWLFKKKEGNGSPAAAKPH